MDDRWFRPSVHPSLSGFRWDAEGLRRYLAVSSDRSLILSTDRNANSAGVAGPHDELRRGIQRNPRVRRQLPFDHLLAIDHHPDPHMPER